MRKDKTFQELQSPIPNKFMLDGTCGKFTLNDWIVYHVLAMHQNYRTNTANVRYNLIKKYKPSLSGRQIHRSLCHLEELGTIEIKIAEYINRKGETYIKQVYQMLGFKQGE